MNWDAAIDLNRTALLRLVTVMFAALGVEAGRTVAFVPQRVRLMVLRLLRPAESALRRLIVLAARHLPMPEYVRGPSPKKPIPRSGGGTKSLAFPLFDKRNKSKKQRQKRPVGPGPRMFFFDGMDAPYTPEPANTPVLPDDLVTAESLCRRLEAMRAALNDLPKQARRLKRAQARRAQSERLKLQGPLRINTPPGHRKHGKTTDEKDVDLILSNCQALARQWLTEQDTS